MIDLTVKTLDSQNHAFSLEDDQITVRGFKEYIAESVAVPAESQRLIYCGRVLQDEKKLNDYDVNGKVIHLVQRAPPQPGQRRNDGGQGQGQNTQRPQHRGPRGHPLGSTMYFGTMSVPADFLEGHGLPVVQLSNSLSNSRLVVARRMLDSANELMDRLDDPNCPINPPSSESNQPPLAQPVPDLETEQDSNPEGRSNGAARLIEATVAAITAALSAAGANNVAVVRGTEGTAARSATVIMDDNQLPPEQPESQQQQQDLHQQEQESQQRQQQQSQSESESSTSNSNGQSRRTTQLPRPPQMAELLGRLLNTQDRLRPYLEHYRVLMLADPSLPPGPGPEGAEENQRIVNGVSESLHFMAHACHALSDIIVNMEQQPPRNLRCRPIIIQHSAILQPGIPVQLEAHISLLGRSAAENGNEESSDTANATAQSEANATDAESNNQQQGTEAVNQQQPQQPQPQQPQSQQEPAQSPFGTVFNLPNNVEVLMEVTPEGNIETAAGNEQSQTGENNNNNNNAGRTNGSGTFPWGSSSPPDFLRLMQTLAGHVLQRGISTTVPTRNPPSTVGAHPPPSTTIDSGNANAGQSTQARSNVGTHPTTATQTRSTPRLHRVFQPQTHPLGVGMNVDSDLEFDLFLPCYSHHIFRPPPNTPNNANATSQGSRANQSTVPDVQTQAQTATTSTSADNNSATSTPPPATSQANANNFVNGSQPGNISINNIASLLGDSTGSIMEMLVNGNVHLAVVGDRGASTANEGLTFTNLLRSRGVSMNVFTSDEANFLYNLPILVVQNMTLEGFMRLRVGDSEPIAQLRRPLQEFFQNSFPNSTPEALQEQATDRLLTQLRPHLDSLLATEEEVSGSSGSRIDICATIQTLLRQQIKDMLRILFSNDIDDAAFGQEMLNIVNNLGRQLCAILRYSIRGGQAGLEAVASRFITEMLDGVFPAVRQQLFNNFIVRFRTYSLRITQPPDSEILPLLIYKDVPSQTSAVPSAPPQPPQAQSEVQPMETEVVEEKTNYETSMQDDGEEIPETFPGHEALPSDWVPIIARDGVRQRRQFQMQGMANGGVTAFSDAYLGALPTKRRKLIEQQKTRLLVSPTPNHSAIAASMERLVREGVNRAGVEEVEGAAVAVAGDSGVRRAFGQAIRDCLNPHRYGMPDFPDPSRFPNATKYFADQDRPPK